MKKFLLLALITTGFQTYQATTQEPVNDTDITADTNVDKKSTDNQKTEKLKNIEEIVNITLKCSSSFSEGLDVFANQALLGLGNINEENTALFKTAQREFYEAFLNEISTPETTIKLAKIYDDSYTDKEISDILNFYKSETGQKVLKTLPEVTLKTTEILGEVLKDHLTTFTTKVAKIASENTQSINQ